LVDRPDKNNFADEEHSVGCKERHPLVNATVKNGGAQKDLQRHSSYPKQVFECVYVPHWGRIVP
jgi:hypothetical protein